ncbi:hypothetical protein [Planctomyces sp. SH-PL62]|uniref:hypothetical protein n=1 Tax=Planctomyces sp. SH-PL62 TaxID=1636152 RepID=UPI00078B5D7A|nr:hypothetical protein [Planctomyces sp. SH-PL62]AMV37928.1 hypothetical protein VT85_10865 [Planctomyces sp. SH-PL62]
MTPRGQRDYGGVRLSRHAVERFVERFGVEADRAEARLREALGRTRRLGRNPANGAIAVLALHEGRTLVAVLQDGTCLTVLTWNQFEPRLPDFGRPKVPRKWGRTLARLAAPVDEPKPRRPQS